jgi:hypothetical protein
VHPVAIVAIVIAAYWTVALVRTRSRPKDWRWPPADGLASAPISLSRSQYMLVATAGIVASLIVVVYSMIVLG